ncbi:hypothetical protein SLH49_21670 [Cognatiyoonia sp. IB215446]|uniref:hypothetical protein n=1 Tax=Cognatiyoonia sp. IB215446 TaxID=3097355 RepID=UPI002A11CC37|nr:hypothetical protein [Cognatiyoonia sp. IB215446]MDX8350607.1 hypothetical protein [Cognatiyoonia sp. IB215446]
MDRAYLIIQKVSYAYITYVTRFIHAELERNFSGGAELIICDEIDEATHEENAIIFVIGEGFARHRRRPGCTYVYLNFSIIAVMGNPLKLSRIGWSAIRRKQRMLREKQDRYDILLDYFPPQTKRLQRRMKMPVFGFQVAIDPDTLPPAIPLAERPYDVCFVGGPSARRKTVLDALEQAGIRLSPQTGVVYEEIAAQSRCCLNIHAYRSNHLEIPRIIGAMATATPLVTEPSYGLNAVFPEGSVTTAAFSRLAETAANLGRALEEKSNDQSEPKWYKDSYLPQSRALWADLCTRIRQIATS